MSFSLYFLLIVLVIIVATILIIIALHRKKSHSVLFNKGLENENEGHYNLALHNYEDALNEAGNNELSGKIEQRIKILRSTIDYEKNFKGSTYT